MCSLNKDCDGGWLEQPYVMKIKYCVRFSEFLELNTLFKQAQNSLESINRQFDGAGRYSILTSAFVYPVYSLGDDDGVQNAVRPNY